MPPVAVGGREKANPEGRRTHGEPAPRGADAGPQVDDGQAAPDVDREGALGEGEAEAESREYEWSLATPNALGNRFEILHAHARGGIGVVSVAFDSELQREVALKQIKAESADDPDSRSRFLLEAEVTGRLEHPGIVPVYGLGFDEPGPSLLRDAVRPGHHAGRGDQQVHAADASRGRDPRERALELRQLLGRFVNVCHTMAYAHSRGVLHRDLKPANVLLGPYNETLIVDWGLAKVLRPGSGTARSTCAGKRSKDRRGPPGRLGSFRRSGKAARPIRWPGRRSVLRPS